MTDSKSVALILLISALFIVLMLPLRDSVYSDDVAFSQSVRHLLQTGELKVSEYTAASSISHILWGSLFAKLLGFSFTSLNISVIVFLPILLISFYKLLRTIGVSTDKSLIFTLFFFSVPWIPFLTYTFMSDIPFLTLEVLTILFYLKYSKDKNIKYLTVSLVFASIAFLVRQLSLALIAGIVTSVLLNTKFSLKRVKKIILPLLIPLFTIIIYQIWLSVPGNKTMPQYFYEDQIKEVLKNFVPLTNISLNTRVFNLSLFLHRTLNYASQAMGLLFPLIFVLIISNIPKVKGFIKRNFRIIIFSTAAAGLLYLLDVINFRKEYYAGFPLNEYEYESLFPIPWAHIWKYLVILSIPFWSSLLAKTYTNRAQKMDAQKRYLLITFLGVLFMTLITFQSWDRYLLPFLPFVFIYLARVTKTLKFNTLISIPIVALFLIDSIQMTKLRYDEAGLLYKIGNQLVQQGVEPSTIDLNRDQGWDIWFYYEKGVQEQIKEANGDKTKINFQIYPLPKKIIKYAIYTDRMIKYQKLDIDKDKTLFISFKSLFVTSKLTFLQKL